MAALSTNLPNIVDVAKLLDPNGKIQRVAEVLTQRSDMLQDMTFIQANGIDSHTGSFRTGVPEPTFRRFNAGVQPSKATTATIKVGTAMLEDYFECDKALADLGGNADAFRMSQDKAKMQGFNNKVQRYTLFGNVGTEPEAYNGLALYYNDLTAENADNIIDAGGTGTDNNSIYLVVWGGDEGITGIYPKGSQAGIQINDKGVVTLENANGVTGARMEAYRTHFKWDLGLFVGDWRQAIRICNIDKSDLKIDSSTGANLSDLMFQATEQIENLQGGRAAFYMSRKMLSMLRRQTAYLTRSSTLQYADVGGIRIPTFEGIPLRRVDAMAADEARVV